MHETVIAREVIRQAEAKAKGKKIHSLRVEAGELAHLPAKELKETLERMTGWKVEARETPARIACACGFNGRPKILEKRHGSTLYACPKCFAPSPEVLEGNGILLVNVECV